MRNIQNNMRIRFGVGLSIFTVAAMLSVSPAYAQGAPNARANAEFSGLDDIIVTAQRRSENLQTVPVSISAVTAEALVRSGVSSTLEISQVVPAIQITRSGPQTILFMRGVGNSSGAIGEEGANAWYIDGVYLGDQSSVNLDFNNIERVEVLKGPQGTLFGRNSSGGLVHIITREPGDTATVKASLGYGNYQTIRGQVYASTPLTDNLAADIAITGSDQGKGWGKNLLTGDDAMYGHFVGARSKIVWKPGAATKVVATGDFRKSMDNVGNAFPLLKGSANLLGKADYYGDYNVNKNLTKGGHIKNWGASLLVEHDFGGFALTSVSALRDMRSNSAVDSDSGPTALVDVDIQSSSRTFQQELRLASDDSGPLKWQAGLFYYFADAELISQKVTGLSVGGIGKGFDLSTRMKTNSYAAFGELTYDLTDTTHLTGGVRFTSDHRAFSGIRRPLNQTLPALITAFTIARPDGSPLTGGVTYKKLTYRFALRQELGDNLNAYASFNRGFKAGLYGLNSDPRDPPVKPQTIDAFEVGLKSQMLENMLRLNLSAFHYKINGYQVRGANPQGGNTSILLNATNVTSKGIEVEAEFAPTKELHFVGNLAYLDATFGKFASYPYSVPRPSTCVAGVNPPYLFPGVPTGGNLTCFGPATGNHTANSPEWVFNFGANYSADIGRDGKLIASVLYTHKSKVFFDTTNRTGQKGFGLLNGSLEFRPSANWGIEFWGKNLTNKTYYVLNLEGSVDQAGFGAPRTYGVNVKLDF